MKDRGLDCLAGINNEKSKSVYYFPSPDFYLKTEHRETRIRSRVPWISQELVRHSVLGCATLTKTEFPLTTIVVSCCSIKFLGEIITCQRTLVILWELMAI